MSKFILPTQKGLELFPNTVVAAPIIRWAGVDPSSVDAQHVLEVFGSALTSFYAQQSQNHSLSLNTQSKATRQIAPGLVATYVNQGGIEYITIWVQPSAPSETRKEAELRLPQPEAPADKCLMVLYDGNKVAAISMNQLAAKKFKPVYTKELEESSWDFTFADAFAQPKCLQYPPVTGAAHSGAWYGDASFTDTQITFPVDGHTLLEPAHPARGVATSDNQYYSVAARVMALAGNVVYAPSGSYEYEDGRFKLIEDRSSFGGLSGYSPTAISGSGTRYYYGETAFYHNYTAAVTNAYGVVVRPGGFLPGNYDGESLNPPYPVPDPDPAIYYDNANLWLTYSNSFHADPGSGLVKTSRLVPGVTVKDVIYSISNPPYTESGGVTYSIPFPVYLTAERTTDVQWSPFSGSVSVSSVFNGGSFLGQPTYTKTGVWSASFLGLSGSGAVVSNGEYSSTGVAYAGVASFPPAIDGVPFLSYGIASGSIYPDNPIDKSIIRTPFEEYEGDCTSRFFVASANHVFCGYTLYNYSIGADSRIDRLYLDGVDVYPEFADALGTEFDRIALVMMDVPLEVIRKFK